MDDGEVTGELLQSEIELNWKIPDFLSLLKEEKTVCLQSPKFYFMGCRWGLEFETIYKSEDRDSDSTINIYWESNISAPPGIVHYTLEIKEENASEEIKNKIKHTGYADFECWLDSRVFACLKRLQFLENKSSLLPSGILTIRCCLKDFSESMKKLDTLTEDLAHLLTCSTNSDVTIQVQKKEFRAHRSILAARSEVLASMFEHDMSESKTGVVNIMDCDPDAFEVFLRYLYTGKAENLTQEKAVNLFKIADKYCNLELKSFCVEFMKHHLSIDSMPIVAMLSQLYEETTLFAFVQDFFNKNVGNVLSTKSWEKLLREDYRLANKLLKQMSCVKKI